MHVVTILLLKYYSSAFLKQLVSSYITSDISFVSQKASTLVLLDHIYVKHHHSFHPYMPHILAVLFQILDYDGFPVHSILSLPIRDSDEKVIGVVQLMNKISGKPFSDTDINIVEVLILIST